MRPPRMLTAVCCASLCLALLGCPGSKTGDGQDGGAGGTGGGGAAGGGAGAAAIPLEALDEAYLNGVCTVITQCYASYYDYCSIAHCTSDTAPLGYDALLLELDAGWTRYDADAAGRCYQQLLADPCRGFFFTVPTVQQTLYGCGDVLTGTRGAGQSCASVADCAPGNYCVTSASCPGTCRPFLDAGASCSGTGVAPCDPSQDLTCQNGVCRGPWAVGDPCAIAADCGEYWCKRDAGTCQPLAKLGEPCERFGGQSFPECEADLRCSSQFGTGTCGPRLSEGQSCFDSMDCADQLRCLYPTDGGFSGLCGARRAQGQPCTSTFDCADKLRCLNKRCEPYPGLGQACSTGFGGTPCADGLLCSAGVCVTALCPGQSCGAAQTGCAESTCSAQSSTCVVRLATGESCTGGAQCASGACTTGRCADPTCRP